MAVKLKTGRSAHVAYMPTVQWLYRQANWNDTSPVVTGQGNVSQYVGVLPANCLPLETYVRVNTAFAGSDLMIGTSAAGSSGAVVSTQDIVSGTTGTYKVDRYMGSYSTSDVPIYFQMATSGATAGQADIWQAFLPVYPAT